MSGVDLRKRLGLKSNFVRFKFFEEESNKKLPTKKGLIVFGQGSGHGVGMSQWGAKNMASRGQKAERILKHFYKGVQVKPFRKITYRSYLALRTNFGFILDSSLFKKPIPSNVCFLSITFIGFL